MSETDPEQKPVRPADSDFHRLKQATRVLVKICGGVESAADLTSYSKSEVSRWQVATAPLLIPIDAALILERECGLALVTSVMASINGRRLVEPEGQGGGATSAVINRYVDVIRAATDLLGTGTAVFADQALTGSESELLHRGVSQLRATVEALDKDLADFRGGSAPRSGGAR